MKQFNLSKYYSINWLLWTSILGNVLAFSIITLDIILSGLGDLFLTLFFIDVITLLLFLLMSLVSLTIPFEFILRKFNKISKYNDLIMSITPRRIIYWLALILIPIDIFIHGVAFYYVDLGLNGPIPN